MLQGKTGDYSHISSPGKEKRNENLDAFDKPLNTYRPDYMLLKIIFALFLNTVEIKNKLIWAQL